ncbi:MAG: YtcA family lipoprotein [Burkholderiaceae bacterium]
MHYRCSAIILLLAGALAGCAGPRAPSFLMFGSYFPAWLVGFAVGIPFTLLLRAVLVRCGLDQVMPLRLLVYTCITVAFAMAFAYSYSPR